MQQLLILHFAFLIFHSAVAAVADGSSVVVTLGPIFQRDAKDRKHALALKMPAS